MSKTLKEKPEFYLLISFVLEMEISSFYFLIIIPNGPAYPNTYYKACNKYFFSWVLHGYPVRQYRFPPELEWCPHCEW